MLPVEPLERENKCRTRFKNSARRWIRLWSLTLEISFFLALNKSTSGTPIDRTHRDLSDVRVGILSAILRKNSIQCELIPNILTTLENTAQQGRRQRFRAHDYRKQNIQSPVSRHDEPPKHETSKVIGHIYRTPWP